MNEQEIMELLRRQAQSHNDMAHFEEDPIRFPRHFAQLYREGKASLQDVEIAAVISAHLAWGRRSMIVRDCTRAMEEMNWEPAYYIRSGEYRSDACSLHRTVMWSDFAAICANLKAQFSYLDSLECLTPDEFRTKIYGQKEDRNAANKKIHMLRRWMVRDDGIVDLGLWKNTDKRELVIPLDVHVHRTALRLGITSRKCTDYKTAREITDFLLKVFPDDPTLGDFALFAVAVAQAKAEKAAKADTPTSLL